MLAKPPSLKAGDKIAIVSLSRGVLGENFAARQRRLGEQRLKELGLIPVYMPNSLRGIAYLDAHPEARAADLKEAFLNPAIKGIFAAIGGDDTYRLLPYLMADTEFTTTVRNHPRLFTGFSDTTNNHLMFYRLGMQSFYGPSFLNDLAELDNKLLPYTQKTLEHFFDNSPTTAITASETWYEERTDFSPAALGTPRVSHPRHRVSGLAWPGANTGAPVGRLH